MEESPYSLEATSPCSLEVTPLLSRELSCIDEGRAYCMPLAEREEAGGGVGPVDEKEDGEVEPHENKEDGDKEDGDKGGASKEDASKEDASKEDVVGDAVEKEDEPGGLLLLSDAVDVVEGDVSPREDIMLTRTVIGLKKRVRFENDVGEAKRARM